MADNQKFRVGIVGVGAIAHACHLPGYAKNDHAQLVAFSDPDPERHKEMGKFYPDMVGYAHYRDMLANEHLDLVSVCTPNKYHAEAAIAAFEAGCHVLLEQPIATALAEADAIMAAAKKARKKLMMALTHRLFSGTRHCKELIQNKGIGKPFMIRARFANNGPYPDRAKSDWSFHRDYAGGGALLDTGIHAIDLCVWLFGPVKAVMAKTATLFKKIEVEDNALLLLEFKNGALGYLDVGWTSKSGFTGIEVYGTEGSVICDYNKSVKYYNAKENEWKSIDRNPVDGGWSEEIGYWLDVIGGTEKLTMDGKTGRQVLEVALAAYESSEIGQRVALEI